MYEVVLCMRKANTTQVLLSRDILEQKDLLYVFWHAIFITLRHLLFPFIISRK
jgi:hypothetical protein